MARMSGRSYGFNLMEICIAVVALGIIAGISVPKYFEVVEKARFAEAKNVLAALRDAQVRYLTEMQHFTNNLAELDTPPSGLRYFTVDITGTDISQAAGSLPGTQVASATRNNFQNANNFPAGYVVMITQIGDISSSTANVQQRLI